MDPDNPSDEEKELAEEEVENVKKNITTYKADGTVIHYDSHGNKRIRNSPEQRTKIDDLIDDFNHNFGWIAEPFVYFLFLIFFLNLVYKFFNPI